MDHQSSPSIVFSGLLPLLYIRSFLFSLIRFLWLRLSTFFESQLEKLLLLARKREATAFGLKLNEYTNEHSNRMTARELVS
jgi:hypothetical protein